MCVKKCQSEGPTTGAVVSVWFMSVAETQHYNCQFYF